MRKDQIAVGDLYWVNVAAPQRPTHCVQVEIMTCLGGSQGWDCKRLDTGEIIRVRQASRLRLDPDVPVVGSFQLSEDPLTAALTIRVKPELRDRVRQIPNWPQRVRDLLADMVDDLN